MGCDLDDEVGVEGGGDPVEQGNGGDDAAGLEAGEGRLGHAGACGDLDLGQAEGQAALADGVADEECPLSLGVAVALLRAVAAVPGDLFVAGVVVGHLSAPRGRSCPRLVRASCAIRKHGDCRWT